MPTESASQALSILRDGSQFQWYVIPLFALVVYVYAVEIERQNWSLVFAGLAFWGMDWFNEIWNGLVFHFTGHAPVWGTGVPPPVRAAFAVALSVGCHAYGEESGLRHRLKLPIISRKKLNSMRDLVTRPCTGIGPRAKICPAKCIAFGLEEEG